jgi:type IV pilus assembly protein PilB
MNGKKLGEILLEEDVLTKRQLQKALDIQNSGDKRKLGEILIELGYLTIEDLTDVMMDQASHAQEEVQKGKRDLVLQKQIFKSKIKTPKPKPVTPTPVTPTPVAPTSQPIDISEDAIMKTKFKLDLKTIIAAAVGISSLVGMWYALQADIQEAKELPKIGNIYNQEYPSRPEGYNWPRSYEQYKDQVGTLQEDMDEVYEKLDEYEEKIEDLEKTVTDLRIKLANKRDK